MTDPQPDREPDSPSGSQPGAQPDPQPDPQRARGSEPEPVPGIDIDFDIDFDGIVQTRDERHRTLCFRRHLDQPVAAVWPYLVRPELLAQWLAAADTLEPAEGGAVALRWLNTDGRAAGTVSRYDPPTLVEYDTDAHGRIRFELQDEGGGTALALEVTLPAPVEDLASRLAGWHLHLDYLADALDGDPADWSNWDLDRVERWQPLDDWYRARYGG
ncbi:hypothetical protein GXW82_19130 [Streptacidiphilus sp. 4-A2]|nr:hypothetical protein [Streptacidiphilus sp. 4-A2]